MSESQEANTKTSEAPACAKCGGAYDLLTILPRHGPRPRYHIFRCIDCGFVDWIADQIKA